ncbi:MAG: nuclear transport factor 2 family protein [Hyphomicrobiaceae bacterium]
MQLDEARAFAADWIAAWNAHDLDRILSHYAEDIVFLSPVAERRVGSGRVVGRAALGAYWRKGLDAQPELAFELIAVLAGYRCLTIQYRNHRGQSVAETVEFGADEAIVRAYACYCD